MALVKTTASSAIAATDSSIVVASATGFAAGYTLVVDQEQMQIAQPYVSGTTIPVLRGRGGTVVGAHPVTATVVCGIASDWGGMSPQTETMLPIAGRARNFHSYSASGAVTLPLPGADEMAELNSTGALTMTLAVPSKDLDGSILWIVANGKAAHTVTVATDIGDGGSSNYDVLTFNSSGQAAVCLIAMNSIWVLGNYVSGTLSNIVAGVA